MKTCTFIIQSRGYGKTYYENKRKEEEKKKDKYIKIKELINNENKGVNK